jgi:hypothetical protein
MRPPRSPAPMRCAPSCSRRIGRTMLRARNSAASTDSTRPPISRARLRQTEASSVAYTSATGCSTNTVQPSESIPARAVRISRPAASADSLAGASPHSFFSAAATWAKPDRSVRASTRAMSGSATRLPPASTT